MTRLPYVFRYHTLPSGRDDDASHASPKKKIKRLITHLYPGPPPLVTVVNTACALLHPTNAALHDRLETSAIATRASSARMLVPNMATYYRSHFESVRRRRPQDMLLIERRTPTRLPLLATPVAELIIAAASIDLFSFQKRHGKGVCIRTYMMWRQPWLSSTMFLHREQRCHDTFATVAIRSLVSSSSEQRPSCALSPHVVQVLVWHLLHVATLCSIMSSGMKAQHPLQNVECS